MIVQAPILLVEDNPADEALALRALNRNNISNPVIVARDGVEAIEHLTGKGDGHSDGPLQPAVVLLDLMLPKMDGLQVLEKIRTNSATKHLPVVMLTTSDEESDMVRSYSLGVNSYVRKPVDFAEFSEAVSQLGLYWLLLNKLPSRIGN
jgi:CheY-like chemotaxis protein